jgi:heme-degrading monooxygenase HmoA
MIARVWTATARPDRVDEYVGHFNDRVLPELARIDGYRGATLVQRIASDPAKLVVTTWWVSEDAIRQFAGPDIGRAVVAEEARRMLLSFDDTVEHYIVLVNERSE